MKFRSKMIIVLEMDESETEVVMASLEQSATGEKRDGRLSSKARKFLEDYNAAVCEFHGTSKCDELC